MNERYSLQALVSFRKAADVEPLGRPGQEGGGSALLVSGPR